MGATPSSEQSDKDIRSDSKAIPRESRPGADCSVPSPEQNPDGQSNAEQDSSLLLQDLDSFPELELVPRPENFEDATELKRWDDAWIQALWSKWKKTEKRLILLSLICAIFCS